MRGRLEKTGIWSQESGVNYTLTATEVEDDDDIDNDDDKENNDDNGDDDDDSDDGVNSTLNATEVDDDDEHVSPILVRIRIGEIFVT